MAAISTLSSSPCFCYLRRVSSAFLHASSSPSPPSLSSSFPSLRLSLPHHRRRKPFQWSVRAVAEEESTLAPDGEESPAAVAETVAEDTVSVPVSPSDMLTMFFKAEGTMDESAVPTVTKTLEGTEGISDLKVKVAEGIASIELTKQTTVQATGVASNLVEIIQGSGFKLQALMLSFADEEDAVN